MWGFRLTRMILRTAVRENNRSRRQYQRKKVQAKRNLAIKDAFTPYLLPERYSSPPIQQLKSQTHPLMPKNSQLTYRQRRQQNEARIQAWSEAHPRGKTALGCGILIVALFICIGISSTVYGSATSNQGSLTASATQSATSPTNGGSLVLATQQTPKPKTVSTPKPKPTPTSKPTPRPIIVPTHIVPTPTPVHTGVNGNPWGYDFNLGTLIYSPNSAFCNDFNCINYFWHGKGFVNECNDGSYSKSGGIRGDCSYHGGEMRPLYSH